MTQCLIAKTQRVPELDKQWGDFCQIKFPHFVFAESWSTLTASSNNLTMANISISS